MENFTQTSGENLYLLCKKYGELVLRYRNKFAGLLPEVYRRRLYKKKGFGSIFEFAAKLAGMSEEQVRRVLNLEKKFEEMPVLREMLVNGEIGVSKMVKVASIATIENQEFLATQVKLLSHRALETFVRDEKFVRQDSASVRANTNLSQNPQNASRGTDGDRNGASSDASAIGDRNSGNRLRELQLNSEVIQKLLQLQRKGIDINELILEFLNKREMEIAQEKEKLSAEAKPTGSRHIPAQIQNLLKKEFGTKCSIEWCCREAHEIHHSQRFGLSRRHDPKYLAPFCEEHHAIAHSIDQKYVEKKISKPP